MTDAQWAVVRLIDQGLSRSQIAAELGVSRTTVRECVRDLCARYECLMHELPYKVPERLSAQRH